MPASHIHQHIAADACSRLHLYRITPLRSALLAGAEGPDPLFFPLLHPAAAASCVRMARMIHTKRTDAFLLALMDACRTDPLLRAYCCGFLAHYAADTICHPFIYAHSLTVSGAYSSIAHAHLEHQLDLLLYRQTGHSSGQPASMTGFRRMNTEEKSAIAAALSKAISAVFPQHALSAARIGRCFDSAVRISSLLRHRPFPRQLHASLLPNEDIANVRRLPWRSLWTPDAERTESFADLYAASVDRAASLISMAQAAFCDSSSRDDMRMLLGGLSYCSGLPWADSCPAASAPGARQTRRVNISLHFCPDSRIMHLSHDS